MKKVLIIGAMVVGIISAAYFLVGYEHPVSDVSTATETLKPKTFSWSYRESEKDGIPHTEISLIAMYENGVSDTKIIDTVEGGCNAYDNTDSDVYDRSTMIICYYAGLGRYFKVVSDKDGYMVQRRIFEEASPDYDPPVQQYETIARF